MVIFMNNEYPNFRKWKELKKVNTRVLLFIADQNAKKRKVSKYHIRDACNYSLSQVGIILRKLKKHKYIDFERDEDAYGIKLYSITDVFWNSGLGDTIISLSKFHIIFSNKKNQSK